MANTVNEVRRLRENGGNDFDIGVSFGLNPDYSIIDKFGKNGEIDTGSVPETLWTGGGLYPFPTSESVLSVVSSSAQDTTLGIGARRIVIIGLDEGFNEIEENVDLDGTNPVLTTNSFYRVNRMYVLLRGSNNTNVGTITVSHSGTPISYIEAEIGQTQQAVYTLPKGKEAVVKHIRSSVLRSATSGSADLVLYTNGATAKRIRENWGLTVQGTAFSTTPFFGGIKITEGTDIWIDIEFVSANNTVITGGFDLVVRNL
jgi:hypothetical protein